MEKNKKYTDLPESIMDLTDAEFLSFLYSERDREERLSRWQGWNNWALAGAFVAVIWTANSIWKDHYYVEGYDVMYFTSGIMAISLLAYSCMIFLKRERGLDFSKMKWFIREVVKNRVCYSVMDVCYKLQKETKVFYDRLSKVSKKGLML